MKARAKAVICDECGGLIHREGDHPRTWEVHGEPSFTPAVDQVPAWSRRHAAERYVERHDEERLTEGQEVRVFVGHQSYTPESQRRAYDVAVYQTRGPFAQVVYVASEVEQ